MSTTPQPARGVVWSRDEAGEYHDGRGSTIGRDRHGWHITIAPHVMPYGDYRGRTLRAAKLKVEEVRRGMDIVYRCRRCGTAGGSYR